MCERLRTLYTKDLMEEVGVSTGFRLIVSSDTYSLLGLQNLGTDSLKIT